MNEDSTNLGQAIRIDDERVRDYLRSVVRGSVEETLNALLEAEAEQLCKAAALRAHRGASRHAGGELSAQTWHAGWRGHVEGAEAATADVRDGDY